MESPSPRIILGVTGGVAAYKSVELCRRLMDVGIFVSPILTNNATRFIGPATFAALASEPPRSSLWDSPEPSPHTTLGQRADLVVVAPATARILASYAHGLSDDLLATTLLATRAPVLMAPAMHTEMWENPAVEKNISLLRSRGVHIVGPEAGPLAGGDQGMGRLASVDAILQQTLRLLHKRRDLSGMDVLITAGGTREPLDPVRFLGNRSSGKQGHSIAQAAVDRGANVTLITTANLPAPHGAVVINVETADQMGAAVMKALPQQQVLIMAAAVADFRPETVSTNKLKKVAGPPDVRLVPTIDILRTAAQARSKEQVIVGFAAETNDAIENGRKKLNEKSPDLVVINDVTAPGAGFEHDTNVVTIIDSSGETLTTTLQNKRTVAETLLDKVAGLVKPTSNDPDQGAP